MKFGRYSEHQVKIYYEDTDAGGVVYHANYLRYMERGRVEWFSELGFDQRELLKEEATAFVVRHIDISYRRGARLEDRLTVRTLPRSLGAARLVLSQEVVFPESGEKAVTAEVEVVGINAKSFRPQRIPARVAERIRKHYPELVPVGSDSASTEPSSMRPEPGPNSSESEAVTLYGTTGRVLRKAETSDIAALAELNLRLLEEERYDRTFTPKELVERMGGFLATGYDAFFILAAGEVAGYALVNRTVTPVYIRQFFVSPQFRRRGLGRAAVDEIKKVYNTGEIDVEVMAWNDLGMKFWTSLGFKHRYNGLRASG